MTALLIQVYCTRHKSAFLVLSQPIIGKMKNSAAVIWIKRSVKHFDFAAIAVRRDPFVLFEYLGKIALVVIANLIAYLCDTL